MAEADYAWGPPSDGPAGELRAARAEAAALREQVAELEAEVENLIVGLCHATLHDGRGGRVGLPMLWRSWFEPARTAAPDHGTGTGPSSGTSTSTSSAARDATPAAATPGPAR
jgi:hypothetical protein